MPVSPHSPWVSIHTAPTNPIVAHSAMHSMQAPENTTKGSLTAAYSGKTKPNDKNSLILAYAISIGALGLAAGLHIKGLSKSEALKDKMLPAPKSPIGIRIPSSMSGLWEYLLGCTGGSFLGYFVHQAGENARVKGYNERYLELKQDAFKIMEENEALKSGDIQAQIKLGRTGVVNSLLDWANSEQSVQRSNLLEKLGSIRDGS